MANRPSSRASTTRTSSRASYVEGGALTPHRPPTSSSSAAARLGGLSAKEVDKISSTIASVRKTKPTRGYGRGDAITEEDDEGDISYRGRVRRPGLSNANGSFVSGSTFNAAPLTSRVPAFSPRKHLDPVSTSSVTSLSSDVDADPDETLLLPNKTRSKGKSKRPEKEDLSQVDRELQEALVLEDLLFVLMGIEGTYVEFEGDYEPEDTWEKLQGARFVVDPMLDPSLKEVVERILPLATHYTAVVAFTELQNNIEYGLVNHALCAAIREILHDYLALVAQLEHQFNTSPSFTLQRFWFYVHPTLHSLGLLHSLTSELAELNSPTFPGSSSEEEDDDSEMDEGLKAVIAQATGQGGGGRVLGGGGLVKGGEVLSVLESLLQRTAGDPAAVALFRPLLLRASQPYARMLLRWVDHGQLDDPHDEFMVKEAKNITRGTLEMDFTDEYWERKYALRGQGVKAEGEERKALREKGWAGGAVVPESLEGWKSKVLLAGKYVNVMRECGLHVVRDSPAAPTDDKEGQLIPIDDEAFYRRIQDAYTLANRSLLRLLLEDQDFPGRLRSLRHHFFLSQGDAFTTFLDSASHELLKKARNVNLSRLQSQFDLAVRNPASSSSGDPYKEDVKVVLAGTTLTDWLLRVMSVTGALDTPGAAGGGDAGEALDALGLMDLNAGPGMRATTPTVGKDGKSTELIGMDALQLDYVVRFPISLVISRKTILRYQLIFRRLLHLKHLEQMLVQAWTDHVKLPAWTTRTGNAEFEGWKRRIFALRGTMLAWVQQMYGFASSDVLERQWGILEGKLGKVQTVDGLLRDHVDFLDTCLKECMLTHVKLLELHERLGIACSTFAKYQSAFTSVANDYRKALEAADGDVSLVEEGKRKQFEYMEKSLAKFEHNFYHHLKVHLDRVTYVASSENLALLALVVRLASVRS